MRTTRPVLNSRSKSVRGDPFTIALPAAAAVLVTALGNAPAARAQQGDLLDFSRLTLVGAAAQNDTRLRLTPAALNQTGAAWYSTRQDVQAGFDTTFRFQMSAPGGILDPEGNNGGDGFAFVIQNESLFVLGGPGAGIGYANIPNSVAVEFDTWMNTNFDINDPNGNHVSVHTNGMQANAAQEAFSLGAATAVPNLSDQQVHTARITYVPGTLRVFVDDLTSPVLSLTSFNLASLLNLHAGSQAYLGFTGATADAYQNHDILSWSAAAAPTAPIPEPGTSALLAACLLPLAGLARRPLRRCSGG